MLALLVNVKIWKTGRVRDEVLRLICYNVVHGSCKRYMLLSTYGTKEFQINEFLAPQFEHYDVSGSPQKSS